MMIQTLFLDVLNINLLILLLMSLTIESQYKTITNNS
jgi:hypothetical protein